MPAFVITTSAQHGKAVNVTMCDSAVTGYPDRRSDVPIKVTVAEDSLMIDGELRPRSIISTTGMNGTINYLVEGSTQALVNRERRTALAKTSALLDQLRDHLLALRDEGEDFSLVAEGLGKIYNFLHDEKERSTAAPRSNQGDSDDAA